MPFRNRLKRLQGKVKGAYQARNASDSPATSTTSLPDVLITSVDTNGPSTSEIGGIRTSAPTPDPQPYTQPPSPCVSAISPLGPTPTRSTVLVSYSPTNLTNFNHIYSPLEMSNSTSPQPPSSTLGLHQRHPTGDPTPGPITESMTPIYELNCTSKPTITGPDITQTLTWGCLNRFRRVLKGVSGGFGPLGPVIDGLSECFGIYEDTMRSRQDYRALKNELESLFSVLSENFSGNIPPTMTAAMNNLCTAIEAELDHISVKESRGRVRLYLEADKDQGDIMQHYHSIQTHLERLKLNADLCVWRTIGELATDARLKSLLVYGTLAACYDSAEARELNRRECTPETRKKVLGDLSNWRHSKGQGNIYWLSGMAGTGKTTIASSLCAMLDKSHELGASFFCSRLLPQCRDINRILPSIAYQLACYSYPFRNALSLALQMEPNLYSKSLPKQLEGLVIKPLRSVSHALPTDLVIVIDALDECEDRQGVGLFLEAVVKSASDLPVKIFVSSRPEPQIRRKIGDTKSQLILHELEHSVVKGDIKLYLQEQLRGLASFISEADLTNLTDQAGVLFIYAATVVRFIMSSTSVSLQQRRVQGVLNMHRLEHSGRNKPIDTLYDTVLISSFNDSGLQDNEKTTMRLVLDTVVCAQEPLSMASIAGLLGLGNSALVQAALEPLWSVLHITGCDGIVTTLHASFPEYMLDSERSKEHGCRARKHHNLLAGLCFKRIKNNIPQFNICGLESSFVLDEQVPNIEEMVIRAIPQELMYACQYWALHLELGEASAELSRQLYKFLSERLLLWIEILNLRKRTSVAISVLAKAEAWCRVSSAPRETEALVHDAWRFVTMFATSSVSRSTPHLYTSMLASWERTGLLADSYIHRTRGLVRVQGTGLTRRQFALLSNFSVGSEIRSIAFSPTGTHIVSGSNDKMIRVWHAMTGKPVMDPIEGHTGSVNSVVFSPDGTRMVSGSSDQTIRVWDVTSGTPVVDPIKTDGGSFSVLAFSPNNTHVASGSVYHKVIRVWNVSTGMPVTGPIVGHTDGIEAIIFSPDGMRIASGSSDKSIRVWDATSGNPVTAPILGHAGSVNSVAFSPDGVCIVSGSSDRTIRVWDATSGMSITDPTEGHTDTVNSVTFSPDGMRIASGSNDKTVRVWEVTSGKKLKSIFKGHTTSSIASVAFSPNGAYIISGSLKDSTICVWDSTGWKPATGPLEMSTRWIDHVPLLAVGTQMISGIGSMAICLRGSTMSRQIPELVDELIAPVTLSSPLLNKVLISPPSLPRTPQTQNRSRWKLVGDTLETLGKARIISGWYIPVDTFWARSLLAFFVLGLLGDSIWARLIHLHLVCLWMLYPDFLGIEDNARALQTAARLKPRYKQDFLVSVLHALARLGASASVECLGFVDALFIDAVLYIASWANIGAMWASDRVKVPKLALVFGTHLLVLCVLFGVVYKYGSPSNGLGIIPLALLAETTRLNPWKGADWVPSVPLSPEGMRVFPSSFSCQAHENDPMGGQVRRRLRVRAYGGDAIAFSSRSARVVARSVGSTIRVWGATSGTAITDPIEGHANQVNSVAFSPDGMCMVSGCQDGKIRVWDATSGTPKTDPIGGSMGSISSVAFSPNGMRIVSGSDRGTIRMWDATSGHPVMGPIEGHRVPVNSVSFSPDGTRIVSHSRDGPIYVWDAASGNEVVQLRPPRTAQVRLAEFLADSRRIVSVSDDLTIRVWDTCMPKTRYNIWELNEEGWVVDDQGSLLLWLPADLRPHLLPARNLYSISTKSFVALNFDGADIGKSWVKCYVCA